MPQIKRINLIQTNKFAKYLKMQHLLSIKNINLSIFIVLLMINLSACSIKRLLPKKKVLSTSKRTEILAQKRVENIQYKGDSKLDFPIIPLQVWAAAYDLDIVIVSNHPKWNMHELARLSTPDGPLWIMKDAIEPSLEQSIIANIPEVETWLPEIPVKRKYYPVEVQDKSTDQWLNLDFKYENRSGELCEIHYEGKPPTKKQPKRNGSTMGHSKDQLIAVLDLPLRNFGKKTSISFDGKPYKVKKILGLMPFKMALVQTQAGLSIGHYRFEKQGEEIIQTHLDKDTICQQKWEMTAKKDGVWMEQKNELRTLAYHFEEKGPYLELSKARVQLWNAKQPDFEIHFAPALPDLRYRFEGRQVSTFIMDVNGQESHAIGQVEAYWTEDGPQLDVIPQKPWWVADRPMQAAIQFLGEGVDVKILREEE
jgi:hypothetical protein